MTNSHFIDSFTCSQSNVLKLYDGCLAVGTNLGKILLIDLNFKKCKEGIKIVINFINYYFQIIYITFFCVFLLVLNGTKIYRNEMEITACYCVLANMNFNDIHMHYKKTKCEDINFAIQLEGMIIL